MVFAIQWKCVTIQQQKQAKCVEKPGIKKIIEFDGWCSLIADAVRGSWTVWFFGPKKMKAFIIVNFCLKN